MTWAGSHGRYTEVPFRRVFEQLRRPVPPAAKIVTAYTNGDVTLRTNRRLDGYHEAADLSGFQGVEPGDFVVHGLDIMRGSIGVSDSRGAISSVCIVCRPRTRDDPRFFSYAMRAQAFSGFPRAMARGVREGGADVRRWDTLAELPLPRPRPDQQRAIADFLETETARIDALITKKRHLRDLTIERFRAFVSEKVALGSSMEVRRVISLRTSGPRGWADRVGDTGAPFIRSQNLRRDGIELDLTAAARVNPPETPEARRSRTSAGDVLIGITGANTGWVGIVRGQASGGYVSQHVAVLRPRGLVPEWLAYSLFAHQAQDQLIGGQYGGTKTQLALDD